MHSDKPTVIVGAGVAGLAAAYRLLQAGRPVILVERHQEVGGLARSFHYDGFTFDTGPHRFHTDYPEIAQLVVEILGENLRELPRSSAVWMFGAYHDWPLRPSSILRFPPSVLAKVAVDLVNRPKTVGDDFSSYIVHRYGRTIYEVFFRPYTRKFLHTDPAELSVDWAKAGVDRAVIDKRVNVSSLGHLIRSTLLPVPVSTRFLYPIRGGVHAFCLEIADRIVRMGGEIRTDTAVTGLEKDHDRISGVYLGEEGIEPDQVLWTAPLPLAARFLGFRDPGLRYLYIVLYHILVDSPCPFPYQWCYFGGEETDFNRTSLPTTFSPHNAPSGKHGITVESSCLSDHERWQQPDEAVPTLVDQLVAVGHLPSREAVRDVRIERIPNTYPIYDLGYLGKVTRLLEDLRGFSNLHLLGRTGSFWYNNMDHSMRNGLHVAEEILRHGSEYAMREEFF